MWVASKFCLISAADSCADVFWKKHQKILKMLHYDSKEDSEDTAGCLLVFHLAELENALGLK